MDEPLKPEEAIEARLIENLQRNVHINPIAEARGYKLLIERGWTMVRIAEKIGKSCGYVSDRLMVLDRLHPKVRDRLFPTWENSPKHIPCRTLLLDQ